MKKQLNRNVLNKGIIAVLYLLVPFCSMLPYLAPTVIMDTMMTDLQIEYSLAGMTVTVMLAMSGVCMFVGSAVQDALGARNTYVLSIWIHAAGCALSFIAQDFVLLMAGRIITGIGFGFCITCGTPYISTWFKGKMLTYMLTAGLITNSLAMALAYSIVTPLMEWTGSWNGVFGIYAVFAAVVALLWTIFGRSNAELDAAHSERMAQKGSGQPHQESSLIKAFRIKQYWILMLIGVVLTMAKTAMGTFLPVYLTDEKGFTTIFASTVPGTMSIASIAGSLMGGLAVARTGRRKPFILLSIIFYIASGAVLTLFSTHVPVIVMAILCGFSNMSIYPPQSNMLIETPQPPNPAILGAAVAMTNGVGQIATLAVSPIFSTLSGKLSMGGAFLVFFGAALLTLFLAFTLKETRPHEHGLKETVS